MKVFILNGFGSALAKFSSFCHFNALNSNPRWISKEVAQLRINFLLYTPLCLTFAIHARVLLVVSGRCDWQLQNFNETDLGTCISFFLFSSLNLVMSLAWWWWFFLTWEDLGRMFDHSFPTCIFFFFKEEISLHTLISLFMPGSVYNVSASWDDCVWMFPEKFHMSLFPDRFPHYAWTAALSAQPNFVRSRVYACFGVTCHLHFLQNDQGLLHATAVTQGWNGPWLRVSTQS